MKRLIYLLMLVLPTVALGGHADVIEVELHEDCSVEKYVAIKDDFNKNWASKYGYKAEVFVPVQSSNLTSVFWVGRASSTEAFGKAWDIWLKDLTDPNSTASKLWARFLECGTNVRRVG